MFAPAVVASEIARDTIVILLSLGCIEFNCLLYRHFPLSGLDSGYKILKAKVLLKLHILVLSVHLQF